jgi:hypothetical protein
MMFLPNATRWCGATRVKPQYVVRVKMAASNNLKKTGARMAVGKNTFSCSIFMI